MSDDAPITQAVIGSWADYISLDWSREEDRPQLRQLFPAWVIEAVTSKKPDVRPR